MQLYDINMGRDSRETDYLLTELLHPDTVKLHQFDLLYNLLKDCTNVVDLL